jgi:acetylornithine deacetylase
MTFYQTQDVVELAMALCQIPSVTGDEAVVINYVESLCKDMGLSTKRQQVGTLFGRDNLFAFCENTTPSIVLTTHLDTVPPHFPPTVSSKGDRLIGRGVCDAKGIAAAMICAIIELMKKDVKEVGLLFLVGEETNSDGAKAAAHGFLPVVKYIINGEPTDLKLASSMKGSIVFELETIGKAGHSAYPGSGFSAVHQLNEDVHQIINYAWPIHSQFGATTVNIGCFEGGMAANVIAEYALAKGIMRTSKDVSQLEATLRSLVSARTKVKILSSSSPITFAAVDGFETCVVSFGSDVPYLKAMGEPFLIGPGSILKAHADDEAIEISELRESVNVYKKLCLKLL